MVSVATNRFELMTEKLFLIQKDKIRKRLLIYTRKAFKMLPKMGNPRILDVGCGSGIPTIELARLSRGEVLGIDIDQAALDRFIENIKNARLTSRVLAANCSMFDMDFADESFNIIWSEGSVYAIGFERGLLEWRRFLIPGGFMVIHDEQGNIREKLEQISNCGYQLVGHFMLNIETWLNEYFIPLGNLIAEFRTKYIDNTETFKELNQAQFELDAFKRNPELNSSVYFVMRKG